MRFCAIADTDKGNVKAINQDSVLIKHANTNYGEVMLAVICDGMGGLSKGEVASATVIERFDDWFENELPGEVVDMDMTIVAAKWERIINTLNERMISYGKKQRMHLGTTMTAILLFKDIYMAMHVGDSRIYYLDSKLELLTQDQTVAAMAVREGKISNVKEASVRDQNTLYQCIGSTKNIRPQVLYGGVKKGAILLCSDGFRHEITEEEIFDSLNPINLHNKQAMHSNVLYLIDLVKKRKERDNISVVLIKVE